MRATQPTLIPSEPTLLKSFSTQTTLFDLIHARQAEVEPGEEGSITDEVVHLLQSGAVTCCGNSEPWTELLAQTTAKDQEGGLGYADDHFEPGG